MKKLITLMTVAMAAGAVASADNYVEQFRSRAAQPAHTSASVTITPKAVEFPDPAEPTNYGELTTILSEDFSKMKKGSEGDPYMTKSIYDSARDVINNNVWQSMQTGLTKTKGWGSRGGCYQAGGMIYMHATPTEIDEATGRPTKEGLQAQFNPYLIDNTQYDPYVVVRFRARAAEANKPARLLIEAAETNGMGPTWEMFGATPVIVESEEWHTYTATLAAGGPSLIISIVALEGYSLYLDDFEVLGMTQYVGTPVPTKHSDYTGTSFVANWNEAHDAESYLLSVTTYNDETGVYDYVIDHKDVGNVTSYKVENVNSGQDYYYSLVGVKGDKFSYESSEMEMRDIETPAPLTNVVVTGENEYTVSWPAVPSAERYNYRNFVIRTAKQDGPFAVTDMNFDKIEYEEEGEMVKGIIEAENIGEIRGYYSGPYFPAPDQQGQWEAYCYYVGKGYLAISPWNYYSKQGASQLESPELDLSKDGGKYTLEVDLFGHDGRMKTEKDEIKPGDHEMPQAIFGRYTFNEQTGEWEQKELVYTTEGTDGDGVRYLGNPCDFEWKHYKVDFEGGTEKTKVIIFTVGGFDWLCVDNLKITQNYKKGETLFHPAQRMQYVNGTSLDVKVDAEEGAEIYHQLQAVKARTVQTPAGEQQADMCTSDFSELTMAGRAITGVESALAPQAKAYVVNGTLYVANPTNNAAKVYNAAGTLLAESDGDVELALNQHGVYVVVVGNNTSKVVY